MAKNLIGILPQDVLDFCDELRADGEYAMADTIAYMVDVTVDAEKDDENSLSEEHRLSDENDELREEISEYESKVSEIIDLMQKKGIISPAYFDPDIDVAIKALEEFEI